MKRKHILWIAVAVAVVLAVLLALRLRRLKLISLRQFVIQGAVIQSDADVNKQLPVADAIITASDGVSSATTHSDVSGYFKLILQRRVLFRGPIVVSVRHPLYKPDNMTLLTGRLETRNRLYIVRLVPTPAKEKSDGANAPQTVVTNVRVRYTINARTETNVGSAVKTFQVVNKGNVPCRHQYPCSPDGRWKASSASTTLDAGADNSFRNVRASCIAGPCPFTRIDSSGFLHGGRKITATALSWSDTATFLLQAEVYHTAINSDVRESYPVIFGRTLSFTLPPTQEGVSLEAEINGSPMVFPLGPDLNLSWATCTLRTGEEQEKTTVYHCELKPGYRFG